MTPRLKLKESQRVKQYYWQVPKSISNAAIMQSGNRKLSHKRTLFIVKFSKSRAKFKVQTKLYPKLEVEVMFVFLADTGSIRKCLRTDE